MTNHALKTKQKTVPEGGWGWFTLVSVIIYNIAAAPPMTFFGFIFKGIADELELSFFQIALIITYNVSLGLILTIGIEPLLNNNYISKRKAAFFGASLSVASFISISFAEYFYQIVVLYSIIFALGMKIVNLACVSALNSYFLERRTMVAKISVISIGLGGVIMAPMMGHLLEQFESRTTVLFLGYLACSLFLAALLLKPVEEVTKEVEPEIEQEMVIFMSTGEKIDEKTEKILSTKVNSVPNSKPNGTLLNSQKKYILVPQQNNKKVNENNNYTLANIVEIPPETGFSVDQEQSDDEQEDHSIRVYLKLLSNCRFVCVGFGVSLNTVAEGVFSALLPFMLYQFKFSPVDVGIGIAFFSAAMILMKYIAVFSGSKDTKKILSPRFISIICIIVLIAARVGISLGFMSNFRNLLIAAVAIGSSKGFLLGYVELVTIDVIPKNNRIHASNIQNLFAALLLLFIGPTLGYLRDSTGSFQMSMFFINVLNSCVIIIWTAELLVSVLLEYRRVSFDTDKQSSVEAN